MSWLAGKSHEPKAEKQSGFLADLELLTKANRHQETEQGGQGGNPEHSTWQQPQGQSGDGRTALNDRYGY